jgi:tripartite-type tricarboxylate transporter receptor subunit TctC
VPYIAVEWFKQQSRTAMAGRIYDGAAPAIADVARGNPQLMFPSLFTAEPYLRSGRLRALAVADTERLPTLPDVPTLAQAGIDGIELTQWYALFAPAHTPQPVVAQWNRALHAVLQAPDVAARFASEGMQVGAGSAQALRELLVGERAKWQRVVQQLDLPGDASTVD